MSYSDFKEQKCFNFRRCEQRLFRWSGGQLIKRTVWVNRFL